MLVFCICFSKAHGLKSPRLYLMILGGGVSGEGVGRIRSGYEDGAFRYGPSGWVSRE